MSFISLGKDDIELILAVQKDSFNDGWNRNMLQSAFNEGRFYAYGIYLDEKVKGIISYSLSLDSADIEGVVVISSERKKGYGKSLLAFALNDIKQKGVDRVFLEVRESNFTAISLYQSLGFNKISVRKKYYSDGENAVVMLKEI